MKKHPSHFIICLFLSVLFFQVLGQDTIYSYYFPNGIVTKTLRTKRKYYQLNPIDNSNLLVTITKESIREINYKNGERYVNTKPVNYSDDKVVFMTNPLTGKLNYTGILEVKNANKRNIYNSVKAIPQGVIKYYLIASDEIEYSFLKYVGKFSVQFAGDPYSVYFNLHVKFKDGKVKYEYSDFVASFAETKTKQSANLIDAFSNGVNTTTREHVIEIDELYAKPGRSDMKKFWIPIYENINESIYTLTKSCSEVSSDKKNDW